MISNSAEITPKQLQEILRPHLVRQTKLGEVLARAHVLTNDEGKVLLRVLRSIRFTVGTVMALSSDPQEIDECRCTILALDTLLGEIPAEQLSYATTS